MRLQDLVRESARRDPTALAVQDGTNAVTYGELDRLADRYAVALAAKGVAPGDRVLMWTVKSVEMVALMQASLRLGAVYVPVSDTNPIARVERIADGCDAALVVTDNPTRNRPGWCALSSLEQTVPRGAGWKPEDEPSADADSTAYILYTSGSTGEPKGVCLTHRNALAFVGWACEELDLGPQDRLSNHAPFNFDLSVFDLYAAFYVGASVHLIDSQVAYAPEQLVRFLVEHKLTVWYSVPSALALMISKGGLLNGPAPPDLRSCVFAGEPFAVEHVRRLRSAWPSVRLFNWYGPTETNVCLSHEVGGLETIQDRAIPIGLPCSGDEVELVPDGGEAELVVSGPTVMAGYWGGQRHTGGYHTGDLVRWDEHGELEYVGRRDHLVKVRGHRIELTEIEAVLTELDAVEEVLVVVVGQGLDARLHAAFVAQEGARPPGLLAFKEHGASRLPTYMLVDAVHVMTELPRTTNGKYDRAALVQTIQSGAFT